MDRLTLHSELLKFLPNAYFQPPSNITMVYPCIVYSKSDKDRKFSNDKLYLTKQKYQIMLIEKNPDSEVADDMEEYFDYCGIQQRYTADNLNHTTLNLYY